MMLDGSSWPFLVQENLTGLVPEPKEQSSVASDPTDVSGTARTVIFGENDASVTETTTMKRKGELKLAIMMK